MIYFVFVTCGYLNGIGVHKVGTIPTAAAWQVATLTQRVWAPPGPTRCGFGAAPACPRPASGRCRWWDPGPSPGEPTAAARAPPQECRKVTVNCVPSSDRGDTVAFVVRSSAMVRAVFGWSQIGRTIPPSSLPVALHSVKVTEPKFVN
jgi:hypothetical protein